MRRAKIRPSINLSASRRNITTPSSQDKESAGSGQDLPVTKTGLRSAAKPSVSESALPAKKPDVTPAKQTQQSQRPEKAGDPAEPPQPSPPPQDPLSSSRNPDPISPVKQTPSSPTKTTPESPSKAAATVRRKRITAVPNLGQPRLRSTPSQPVKVTSKPQLAVVEKENEVGKSARGGGGERGRKESGDGGMGPPQPPPIQRVISSTATTASTQSPAKERTTTAPSPKETSHQTQTNKTSSQINPMPGNLTTPVRPALARSESVTEKTPGGSENIYEKKLRVLKDRMDSETPAKRRRNYVQKKTQPPERSKMTMSDLIYFNPKTSPMKNTSGNKEKQFPRTIMTEHVVSANNSVNSSAHNSDNEEEEEEEEEKEEDVDPFAPQVKIGPDGSIILDSTSLVKDASPAKTLHLENSEAVQEESSHTTYASFGKRTYTTAWSAKDNAKFYMALSAVGTDFTMINAMFPNRTRQQIKNKFKREERLNRVALDKAIRDRKHFDMSLFTKEPSSDSETENRVTKKMKTKEGAKSKGRGKDKSKGKGRKKVKDRGAAADEDFDVEFVETEEASKRDETPDGGTETTQETAARLSEASDEEINMETILSQPTRSGRQPKFKSSFTIDEPPKKTRGPYRKTPKKKGLTPDEDYALKQMERLSQERVKALAQKQKFIYFPPYQLGRLSQPTLQHPPHVFTRQTNGSPLGGQGRIASPGSRGTSTISTPMGRFIVSVPQQQRREGESLSPASPRVQSASGGASKPIRSHIFVISSPDGTQNIIHVPVQTETSPAGDQAQNPPANVAPSRPTTQNPMTTPGIVLKNLALPPLQNQATVIHQLSGTLPQTISTQPSRAQLGSVRFTNPMSTPHILVSSQGQRAPLEQSRGQSSTRHRHPEPITVQTGSNKTIVMSPHAAAVHQRQILEPVSVMTTSHDNVTQQCPTVDTLSQGESTTQASDTQHEAHRQENLNRPSFNEAQENTLTPDLGQNVSHVTSDTNNDWLLGDVSVGHKVDISTTDSVEMEIETEEAFVPAFSNRKHSPLPGSGASQVTVDHDTEEHLSARDILEQMTFEEGVVGGDVGANMEIAIDEEIITQIASETTVE